MFAQPVRHRRVQRADFDAIRALLADSGLPVPDTARAGRHHFRRLMADLGADFYLAERGLTALGLVHLTYVRRLAESPAARIELLLVAPLARGQGIGRGLAALAAARARRRGCAVLRCRLSSSAVSTRASLGRAGWRDGGGEFEFDLAEPAE